MEFGKNAFHTASLKKAALGVIKAEADLAREGKL